MSNSIRRAKAGLISLLAGAAMLSQMSTHAMSATPVPVRTVTESLQPVGQTTFRFLFWRYFEAELWTVSGRFDWNEPMALALTYRTDFSAADLTEATVDEMDRVSDWSRAKIEGLRPQIAACMADVDDGDSYLAYSPDANVVELYLNGAHKCRLSAPGIRQAYMGIWLSTRSRFPDKSLALRGNAS